MQTWLCHKNNEKFKSHCNVDSQNKMKAVICQFLAMSKTKKLSWKSVVSAFFIFPFSEVGLYWKSWVLNINIFKQLKKQLHFAFVDSL